MRKGCLRTDHSPRAHAYEPTFEFVPLFPRVASCGHVCSTGGFASKNHPTEMTGHPGFACEAVSRHELYGSWKADKYLNQRQQDSSKDPEGLSAVPKGGALETWAVALCTGQGWQMWLD